MKKLLLSTALLSVAGIAYSTNTAEAADALQKDQATEIGVKFQGEEIEPEENGVGNIVMGKGPTAWEFQTMKTNLLGGTTRLKDEAKQNDNFYVMVNDDRSNDNTEATKKQTPWKLSLGYTKLNNGKTGADKKELLSDLTLTMGDVYEYYAGDILDKDTPNERYPFPSPTVDSSRGAYDLDNADAGVASAVANKALVLDGQNTAPVLVKEKAGLDKAHSKQNMGTKEGGQGYLVSFKNPTINIKESTTDLSGQTYKGELVYSLDMNN